MLRSSSRYLSLVATMMISTVVSYQLFAGVNERIEIKVAEQVINVDTKRHECKVVEGRMPTWDPLLFSWKSIKDFDFRWPTPNDITMAAVISHHNDCMMRRQ